MSDEKSIAVTRSIRLGASNGEVCEFHGWTRDKDGRLLAVVEHSGGHLTLEEPTNIRFV
jgi:hypothetical protein